MSDGLIASSRDNHERRGMDQLSQNLPGIVALALIVGVCAFAGIRVGPRFLIRRIAGIIFVLFGVTFITFILGYFAPGNAVLTQTGGHAPREVIEHLMHLYGLDLPWYEQYARFLNGLLHFNLGYSYIDVTQTCGRHSRTLCADLGAAGCYRRRAGGVCWAYRWDCMRRSAPTPAL